MHVCVHLSVRLSIPPSLQPSIMTHLSECVYVPIYLILSLKPQVNVHVCSTGKCIVASSCISVSGRLGL